MGFSEFSVKVVRHRKGGILVVGLWKTCVAGGARATRADVKQVPPLRRRIRSGSGRNDRDFWPRGEDGLCFCRPSGAPSCSTHHPQLALWAAFFRRFAAGVLTSPTASRLRDDVMLRRFTQRWAAYIPRFARAFRADPSCPSPRRSCRRQSGRW